MRIKSLFFFFVLLVMVPYTMKAESASRNLFSVLLGKSETEIQNKMSGLWHHFFTPGDLAKYEQQSECSVYYESVDSMAFILDTGNNDVRTEGMSYGMMISVQLNHRKEFDKLWKWAKRYMAYPSSSAWDGYFCWQCRPDGTKIGESNASDGEIYFVTALYLAAERWHEPTYAVEADKILSKVQGKDGKVKGVYSMFDKKTSLVTFCPTEDVHWFSDPSYCLPAFLDYWAVKSSGPTNFWNKTATAARQLLIRSSHPTTGLYPDYCLFDGTPYSWPGAVYNTSRYQFDAIRCAMNVGMDYYLCGKDKKRQSETMRRLLTFFDRENYRHGHYDLDGTNGDDSYSIGMIGANAVGAFALMDGNAGDRALAKKYVQTLWDAVPPSGKWRYYQGMVYFLSMLHVSGQFSL